MDYISRIMRRLRSMVADIKTKPHSRPKQARVGRMYAKEWGRESIDTSKLEVFMTREIEYRGESKTINEWAGELGLSYNTLWNRLARGWDIARSLETPPLHQSQGTPTHGMRYTKEYRAWLAMKRRCSDPKRHNAHRYVGRGITICEEWQDSFEAFFEHVGPAPTAKHSLDRINNDRDYMPGNVRWATAADQARNRSVR